MVALAIEIPTPAIGQFCRRHHIRRLSLFGSVVRGASAGGVSGGFTPSSDVDVLVDFAPGQTPGLALIDMQDELSGLLNNRRVDLVTEKFLNRRIRQSVLASAVVLYEE